MKLPSLKISLYALACGLIASASLSAFKYEREDIEIWKGETIPFNKEVITLEETIDKANKRFSQVSNPVMYVFRRTDVSTPGPAALSLPGGGYSKVSIGTTRGESTAKRFFKMGFHTVGVLKYRLPNPEIMDTPHFAPLADVQKAFSLLHRNAKEWNIDRKRIGVKGASAGGHLAASLNNLTADIKAPGVTEDELEQAFSILRAPALCFKRFGKQSTSMRRLLGSRDPDPELVNYFSMEDRINAKTPPTFLVASTDDGSVPYENSKVYAEYLEKAGIPYKYVELSKGGHSFGFSSKKTDLDWVSELDAWLTDLLNL